ncbi:MAG: InlB B-repeat-containing protein, partial [Bacteroidales bacterium]|nr:InlB B-repeat-containing protein [Bacteroidales bacterium]
MKKIYKASLLLMLFFLFASVVGVMAQPSRGGIPPSFKTSLADENQPFLVSPPDVQALLAEDEANTNFMPRAAVVLPVDLNPTNSGEWITLETGETIWRLAIECEGAKAILLTYSNFNLPKDSKLFIYNKAKTQILGAYTEENNPIYGPEFSTELVAGDHIVLEYVAPRVAGKTGVLDPRTGEITPGKEPRVIMPTIQIDGIGYAYNNFVSVTNSYDVTKTPSDLGSSGSCQVNINCSLGAQWQNQKKGVAATLQKIRNNYWICTGSLVNNIRQDLTPYFLMAWHCSEDGGNRPTVADYNQWLFYFHWERAGCENTTAPITYRTVTGCQHQAESSISGGSDGLLIKLNQSLPAAWDLYYNGWDAAVVTSWPGGGAGIHHPSGDVKKISVTSATITQTTWSGGVSQGHWTCSYGQTVTEGGSSGSPMFNSAGKIIGTLTGGAGSCSSLNNQSNIYGKFGHHFDKFGTEPLMKTFLDPDNTGDRTCDGRYTGTEPIANFTASTQTPYAMQPVQFYSQSFNATSYAWEFPGGTPSSSTETNPIVTYPVPGGPHNVSLTINGGEASKTEIGFITVSEKLNDEEITIGTGTQGANFPLGYPNSNARVHQATLYTPAQLGAAGLLKSIAWYAGNARTTARTIRVWIEYTTATDVTGVTAWNINDNPTGTATLVAQYTGQSNVVGWNSWNFNVTPFNYNGTSNVIIYVEVFAASNSSALNSMTNTIRYTATGTNTNRTWYSNATTQPTGNLATNNQVPNLRIIKGMPSQLPVANFTGPVKFDNSTSDFKEGFEQTTFPPITGTYGNWTMTNSIAGRAWYRAAGVLPFNTIDPTSTFSAVCPWANTGTGLNNQLISPEINITSNNCVIEFWAMWEENYCDEAHLEFRVSTNGPSYSTWTSLWSMPTVTSDKDFTWYKITVDMSAYIGQTIKFQYWATGTGSAPGYHMAVDGISLGRFDPLGKFQIYKDEVLQLTDLSTGPPVVWDWEFPGSSIPEVQTFSEIVPPVQYEYAGTYDLGLTVTNLKGSDTKYMQEQVVVVDRMPRAAFTAKSDGYDAIGEYIDEYHPFVIPGGTVTYTNTSECLPDSYLWTFDGGVPTTSTVKDPIVTYNQQGDHSTSLKVLNSAGESTKVEEDLVYTGYGPEYITNGNFPGGAWSIWTAGTNQYVGGTGVFRQIAEKYAGPPAAGQISEILTYVGGRGTTATTSYTISIRLAGADGNPASTTLWSQAFTLGTLPTAANLPAIVSFPVNPPVSIPVGQAYFVHVTGFTANYAAGTFLHFIVSMGDPVPESTVSTAYGNTGTGNTGWGAVSTFFLGDPCTSYALWPEFTYTQLDVNPTQLTIPNTAGTQLVTVTSNVTYTTNTSDTWYTLTTGSTGVTVNYTANTTGAPREGSFNVVGGGVTKTVTVLQAIGTLALNVSPSEQIIPNGPGSASFEVTSNIQWVATSSEPWVVIPNPTGMNNGTLTVNVGANMALADRTALITVSGGGLSQVVTLTQVGNEPYLEIAPDGTINVPKMDGSRFIQVSSNIYWFATANQPWINFTQQSGDGDGYVYFSFNANPTTAPRTAVITVSAGALTKTLTVVQDAGDGSFTITQNFLQLPHTAGSQNVTVVSPTAWIASTADNWYTVSPMSGNAGTQIVTINYTANNNPTNRNSEVTFNNGSAYRYLQIVQKGMAIVSWNTPVNGTIQVLNGATPIANGASVELGTQLTVVATPTPGYAVSTLTLNGIPLANNGSFIVEGESIINVQFDVGVYTLFFDPNGGTVSTTSKQVTYGTEIGELPVPTLAGYTFSGWFIGSTQIFATTVWNYPSHQTAVAHWTANTYTLTLNSNGGTGAPASITVTYNQPIGSQLVSPTRTGYTFSGWFIGTTQIYSTTTWTYLSNQTATASWTANTYTLTFNPGLGTVNPTSITVTYGLAIGNDIPIPERPGYTYTGWVISGTPISATTVWNYTQNQTATTGWNANTYTLTLDPLNGSVSQTSWPVTYNSTIGSLPNANLANCPFVGWFIGTTQISGTTTWSWTSNQTATARYNYPILATSSGPGTINSSGTSPYSLGQNATYTCTPSNGAHIVTIVVDGATVFTGDNEVTATESYTFTNINNYHTIHVTFATNCYALNPGNILGNGASINMTPANCVPHGSSVTFNFVTDCYSITDVIIGGDPKGPITTYTMPNITEPLPIIEILTTQQQYTITATPVGMTDPLGQIVPSGVTTVACGEDVTYNFVITEPTKYKVSTLLIDGDPVPVPPTNSYTFTNVHANHTIHIEFEEATRYIIQFGPSASQNAGGIVYYNHSPEEEYFVPIDSGSNAPFTIEPNEGYMIDKVYVDNIINNQAATTGTYTFTNVIADHSIFATFKKIQFTIIATADSHGTIDPSGTVLVNYGEIPAFHAYPNTGYELSAILVDGVKDDDASETGVYTFPPVFENHTIAAQFVTKKYFITATAGPNGTINPESLWVNHGANQTFTFIPATGYKVNKVFVDGLENTTAAITGNYTFVNVTEAHEITVTFTKKTFTITATFSSGGYTTPSGVATIDYNEHSEVYVFVHNDGYHVKSVLIDGVNNAVAVENGFYRFMNVTANHTIHVIFEAENYTITASASAGGTINPAGVITVPNGANKTFYIQELTGNKLVRVLIDGINDENAVILKQYTFDNVSANHKIIAQFEKKTFDIYWQELPGVLIVPVDGSVSPVEYGGKYKFKADLQVGYTQSNLIVRANNIIINPIAGVYSINNIVVDQEITVSGLELNQYKIVAKAYTGGTIAPAGTFMVTHGDSKEFKISANKDYVIDDVVVNGVSIGAVVSYIFNDIQADGLIEAYFNYDYVGINETDAIVTVFSHKDVVTIVNEKLIPIQQVEIMDMFGRVVWTGQALTEKTEITLNVA